MSVNSYVIKVTLELDPNRINEFEIALAKLLLSFDCPALATTVDNGEIVEEKCSN